MHVNSHQLQNLGYAVAVIFVLIIGIPISPSLAAENQTIVTGNLTSNQTAIGNQTSNQTDGSSNVTSNTTNGDIIGAGRRK